MRLSDPRPALGGARSKASGLAKDSKGLGSVPRPNCQCGNTSGSGATVEEQLGRAVFIRRASHGYTESTFRGRDFWVQAVSHRDEVNLYAVTSCSSDFNPTFAIPSDPESPVKLESSTHGCRMRLGQIAFRPLQRRLAAQGGQPGD